MAETNANACVQTVTGSIHATLNDPKIIKAVDETVNRMRDPFRKNLPAVGMI